MNPSSVFARTVQVGSGNDVRVAAYPAHDDETLRRPAAVSLNTWGIGINVGLDITPRGAVELGAALFAAVDRLSKAGDAAATKALEFANAGAES